MLLHVQGSPQRVARRTQDSMTQCTGNTLRRRMTCTYKPSFFRGSHILAINDEAMVFCHSIVETTAGGVCLMGLPVDPLDTRCLGLLVDALDQCFTDASTALGFRGEEILQVAREFDARGAAMEQVMRQARQ